MGPFFIYGYPVHRPNPKESIKEKLAQLDWLGAILSVLLFTLFQIAATFSGSTWTWSSGGTIAIWVIMVVLAIVLAIQQTFSIFTTEQQRILPLTLLRSRTIALLTIGSFATRVPMAIGIFYIPLFFEFTLSDTAIYSAVRLLPFIIILVFAMMFSGATLPRHGRYNILYIFSGICIIVAGACMHSLIHFGTPTSHIYGFEALLAIGAGLAQQTAYSIGVMEVVSRATGDPREDILKAVCLINLTQMASTCISLSAAGCIYENVGFIKLREALVGFGLLDSQIRSALGGAYSTILAATANGGSETLRLLALTSIVDAMNQVYLIVVVAGAVCFIAGLLMKWEKVNLTS